MKANEKNGENEEQNMKAVNSPFCFTSVALIFLLFSKFFVYYPLSYIVLRLKYCNAITAGIPNFFASLSRICYYDYDCTIIILAPYQNQIACV